MQKTTTKHACDYLPSRWIARDGEAVSCDEKIKVLNGNLQEIREMCQHALEDAVLMGCSEHFVRVVLSELVASLDAPFAPRRDA